MSRRPVGRRTWVVPGGCIPATSTGHEPERTSRDELFVLNTGADQADVELEVFHEDRDPVGPYPLVVPARRVRRVRINDLVDPQAVPLGVPYGLVVRSSVPVHVQVTRVDTHHGGYGTTTVVAIPED